MTVPPPRDGKSSQQHSKAALILAEWIARPASTTNTYALLLALVEFGIVILFSRDAPNPNLYLRNLTMILIGAHGIGHMILLATLKKWSKARVPQAESAYQGYLARGRLTSLDLALGWVAVAIGSSMVDVFG